jgi:WD repeat-containing protein 1 (actin-interacting protein 1)
MASIQAKNVYCGVPNTTRGEATHISADPSGATDFIAFPCSRVAVVRSTTDPLDCSVFTEHANPVTCVRFLPDGDAVASGDEGGFIRVWDRKSHRQLMQAQVMAGPVRDVSFSADQKFLVVTGEARGAFAKIVKFPSGAAAGVCNGHTKRVVAADIAACKPPKVATASEDMSVGTYKGPPVRELDTPAHLKHHAAFVNDVRFSPDATMLAIASSDKAVSLVDVATNDVRATLTGHAGSVTGVSWGADSTTLMSSSNDKSTKTWSISSGGAKCTSTISFGKDVSDMQVGCAVIHKTNGQASVSLKGEIFVTSAGGKSPHTVLRGHSKQIVGLAVVGPKAYSADYSGLMVAWDIGVGSSDVAFSGKGPSTSLCAVASNDAIVATVGQDGKVFVTPTKSLTYSKAITVQGGGIDIAVPSQASSAPLSAIMINESRIVAISPSGDSVLSELDFPRGETGTAIAVNADASRIAVGVQVPGGGGELRLAKLSGSSLTFIEGKVKRIIAAPNKLAFSPDGSLLVIGEMQRRVKLLDVETLSDVYGGGIGHSARVDAVAFAPCGTRFASGGMDGSIALWTVNSDEEPLRVTAAHKSGITGMAFSDASTLVSTGGDSCVRTWTI